MNRSSQNDSTDCHLCTIYVFQIYWIRASSKLAPKSYIIVWKLRGIQHGPFMVHIAAQLILPTTRLAMDINNSVVYICDVLSTPGLLRQSQFLLLNHIKNHQFGEYPFHVVRKCVCLNFQVVLICMSKLGIGMAYLQYVCVHVVLNWPKNEIFCRRTYSLAFLVPDHLYHMVKMIRAALPMDKNYFKN